MNTITIRVTLANTQELEELRHSLAELIHQLSHPNHLGQEEKTIHLLSNILSNSFRIEE